MCYPLLFQIVSTSLCFSHSYRERSPMATVKKFVMQSDHSASV